jgi:hypothetical protein
VARIQLEKQNERLKDALMRLRDLTAESDSEHRRRIADLEKELDLTTELQGESLHILSSPSRLSSLRSETTLPKNLDAYEAAASRLESAEAQVEDLKIQLDDAMGAEDMLEQLTERNLTLTEVRQSSYAHLCSYLLSSLRHGHALENRGDANCHRGSRGAQGAQRRIGRRSHRDGKSIEGRDRCVQAYRLVLESCDD